MGEKVLTQETHALGADDLVVLVNQEYETVREMLRSSILKHVGIEEEIDNGRGPIPKPSEERFPYRGIEYPAWPPLGEGLSVFNDRDKQATSPKEYQLTSKPYNRLEDIAGYSEVRIRVTDGKELLGKRATVLQVRRRDYSKERARLHHSIPIPLPYKESLTFSIVTNTEVAMIEAVPRQLPGLVVRYFVPNIRMGDKSYLENFLISLKKASTEF
ncbi:MAG: hypothetical protein ABW047_07045 [Nitrospiraceae bacterium]